MQHEPGTEEWQEYDPYTDVVNDLCISAEGTLWIASDTRLYKISNYRLGESNLEFYDYRDGLPILDGRNDKVGAVASDSQGNVWIATRGAVAKCSFPDQ